jgi:hypothetical protein
MSFIGPVNVLPSNARLDLLRNKKNGQAELPNP